MIRFLALLGAFFLCAVAVNDVGKVMRMPAVEKPAEVAEKTAAERIMLEPIKFQNLSEFNFAETSGMVTTYGKVETRQFLQAMKRSCDSILNRDPDSTYGPHVIGGKAQDWQVPCRNLPENLKGTWLQDYFRLYRILDEGDEDGLFTGYYEPLLRGSYEKTDQYKVPLYAMPDDLVVVNLGEFSDDLKGRTVRGMVEDGQLTHYHDRQDIDEGALNEQAQVLAWVDDAVDAFFLQIQGSGVVELPDGTRVRIGYAEQNGHDYYAIGRALIDEGALTKENVSLQTIRQWLADNPERAAEVMQLNPSYVFFRKLENVDGPLGAQGVSLTPEYSLAVDRMLYPYGMPVLLEAEDPLRPSMRKFRRLMVAQDTGGAIKGPVRGDVFWGAGKLAERKAGNMKSKGRMWVFLPRSIKVPGALLHK